MPLRIPGFSLAQPDTPSVDSLSLPRLVHATDHMQDALTALGPPPGMYLINIDRNNLQQWVVDHWEVLGAWAVGSVDDPFANVQIAAQRAFGIVGVGPGVGQGGPPGGGVSGNGSGGGAAGGGGVSPAPRPPGSPSITDPGSPFFSSLTTSGSYATQYQTPALVATLGNPVTLLDTLLGSPPFFIPFPTFAIPSIEWVGIWGSSCLIASAATAGEIRWESSLSGVIPGMGGIAPAGNYWLANTANGETLGLTPGLQRITVKGYAPTAAPISFSDFQAILNIAHRG